MIRVALAMTSCGNRIVSIEPDRAPCASASRSTLRLRPTRPPTPIRVKPKPSWMPGLNSTEMIARNEKPSEPSGNFVVITPIAVTDTTSSRLSWRMPAYSPRAVSMLRNPPPLTTPASSDRPTPVGGLNARVMSTGPALPPPSVSAKTALEADLLDHRDQRAERRGDVGGQADGEAAAVDADRDGERADLHRPQVEVAGELDLQGGAALEEEPALGAQSRPRGRRWTRARRRRGSWRGTRRPRPSRSSPARRRARPGSWAPPRCR